MMDCSNEALNSAILSWTDWSFSAEKVEARETRAKMGFSPPILVSSARTASASASGWIALNFEAITSRASITLGVWTYLSSKDSWSVALCSLSYSSY